MHEAIALARTMEVEDIRLAANLAGRPADGDALIHAAKK